MPILFEVTMLMVLCAEQQSCADTEGWRTSSGNGCAEYTSERWCADGDVLLLSKSGEDHDYPERNCCVCGKARQFGIKVQAQVQSTRRTQSLPLAHTHFDETTAQGQVLRNSMLRAVAELAQMASHEVVIHTVSADSELIQGQNPVRIELEVCIGALVTDFGSHFVSVQVARAVSKDFFISVLHPSGLAPKFKAYAEQQGVSIKQAVILPAYGFDSIDSSDAGSGFGHGNSDSEYSTLAPTVGPTLITSSPTDAQEVNWSSSHSYVFTLSTLQESHFDRSTANGRVIHAAFKGAVAHIANVSSNEITIQVSSFIESEPSERRTNAGCAQVEIQVWDAAEMLGVVTCACCI